MILFVDDEPYRVKYYLQELREVFGPQEIHFKKTVAEAEHCLREHAAKIRALVLDIMMPPKEGWDLTEVEQGLSSGIKFLEENADLLQLHRIPVIILTNRDVSKIGAAVARLQSQLHTVNIYQKTQTPAWHLPNIVQELW
ncbi:MAG: hypothetical protein RBU21_07905 [FCB group bacterium]|jgi:CheY-like chemotaxis protein|nr:hypothetical protein [FCB group bacterium]